MDKTSGVSRSIAKSTASDWRPLRKNTLRGFFTLTLPSGLIFRECMLHERDDGRRWIGLPAKPYTNSDGGTSYANIIDFANRETSDRFQREALAAIDLLLLGVHE